MSSYEIVYNIVLGFNEQKRVKIPAMSCERLTEVMKIINALQCISEFNGVELTPNSVKCTLNNTNGGVL